MDFFIAHVRIAGNSQCMEKYGLEYLLKYFESCGVKIDTITIDQHLQIRSFLKKEYPHICHQFDIWHRSKKYEKETRKNFKKEGSKRFATMDYIHPQPFLVVLRLMR